MSEAQDSKVKVAEKVHRRYPNYNGHYRGDGEGSRYNSARREDARNGSQEGQKKPSSEQTRAHHSLSGSREETREEAKGTEVRVDSLEKDKGLHMIEGVTEDQEALEEDVEMELDAINATLPEDGIEMDVEDDFQTLSEEEAEKASRDQEEKVNIQEEEVLSSEAENVNGPGAGELATRKGTRKRLFKPSINTAGSIKMRIANALVSPCKRAAAKAGPRNPPESCLFSIQSLDLHLPAYLASSVNGT
ncbi:hypothetical protein Bca4012_051218 [Brassica carinata]